MNIDNRNLHYKKDYSVTELIKNIDNLFPSYIIKTQKNLTDEFIEKYILNERYYKIREDHDITGDDILNYYPNFIFNDKQ